MIINPPTLWVIASRMISLDVDHLEKAFSLWPVAPQGGTEYYSLNKAGDDLQMASTRPSEPSPVETAAAARVVGCVVPRCVLRARSRLSCARWTRLTSGLVENDRATATILAALSGLHRQQLQMMHEWRVELGSMRESFTVAHS